LSSETARAIRGKRVVAVDDVWDTGLTLGAVTIPLLKQAGAKVKGALVLANRGTASLPLFCPFQEYWKISSEQCFHTSHCPMCKAGEPITEF
jgi:adenine/guanine phosphoribosyltransferase-like PRPP-binding protein